MLISAFGEIFIPGLLSHHIPGAEPERKAHGLSTGVSENFLKTMFSGRLMIVSSAVGLPRAELQNSSCPQGIGHKQPGGLCP